MVKYDRLMIEFCLFSKMLYLSDKPILKYILQKLNLKAMFQDVKGEMSMQPREGVVFLNRRTWLIKTWKAWSDTDHESCPSGIE